MNFHWLQALRALILLSFSALIFMLHHTGEIVRFINPEYVIFSQIASILFLLLFFIQVPRIWHDNREVDHSNCGPWGCNHDDGYDQRITLKIVLSYLVIIVPILTGFIFPVKELDASIAAKRAIFFHSSHEEEESCTDESHVHPPIEGLEEDLLNMSIINLDKHTYASYLNTVMNNPHLFKGKPIQLEGFVLKDETLNDNHWVLARFLVTHCVADASVLGVLVELNQNEQLLENTWIRVQGIIQVNKHHGSSVPVIKVVNWKQIEQLRDPYIYPGKNR